jgi:undecaprenyl-phosphate 4-deoxy-4-formamido-L-arabinose transferase
MAKIYASIVIPVYNEEQNLEPLFARLTKVMDGLGKPYEIIFTNDGSRDRSEEILHSFFKRRPEQVRVVNFNGNYGQHIAVIAAFERVRGEVVVTLDADLQNPPEEIPKLLAAYEQGFDAIGGRRMKRKDTMGRRFSSWLINRVRERFTGIVMQDQGCMLRAYSRRIVDAIARSGERATFIPALAYTMAARPTEVEVEHSERAAGVSKYNYYKLIRLNFDLITGFTLVPLQLFTLFSFACAFGSLLLVGIIFFRRIVWGAEVEGVFTLFAIMFFLVSVLMVGIGLLGEYVGRAYQAVQQRPRYVLRSVFEKMDGTPEN